MLKLITTTMAAMSLLTLGVTASAQVNSEDQITGLPPVAGQAAGGLGAHTMWAFIRADGSHDTVSGSGVNTSQKLGLGTYEVIFRRDVDEHCVYVSGVGEKDFGATPAFVDVVIRSGTTKGVFVETRDTTGVAVDHDFAVYVSCSQ